MKRWWYTEDEWSKYIGWGKLPKKYAKPKIEDGSSSFDYRDAKHRYESWDQFIVRKLRELRGKK
jgi:hypothetical protein